MHLPSIAPGKRFTLPRPFGSADALLLANFAQAQTAQKKLTAIVTAEPADTQRLEGELAFFAPNLRVAVFPDWETLPYDTFSPHQDLISERLATLWRIRRADGAGQGEALAGGNRRNVHRTRTAKANRPERCFPRGDARLEL